MPTMPSPTTRIVCGLGLGVFESLTDTGTSKLCVSGLALKIMGDIVCVKQVEVVVVTEYTTSVDPRDFGCSPIYAMEEIDVGFDVGTNFLMQTLQSING